MPTHQSPAMLKSALPCAQNNAIELLAKECNQDNDSVEYTHPVHELDDLQLCLVCFSAATVMRFFPAPYSGFPVDLVNCNIIANSPPIGRGRKTAEIPFFPSQESRNTNRYCSDRINRHLPTKWKHYLN